MKNKYTKWYFDIINRSITQNRSKGKGIYFESHHIIPKSMGGDNSKENLVLLTAKEHYIVHFCLVKCIEEQYVKRMKRALSKMQCFNEFQSGRSSLRYVISRKMMSGMNNPMYGVSLVPKNKGKKMSVETREKIKKSHWLNNGGKIKESTKKLWKQNRIGKGNSMFGKKHSAETKHKISMANKNKPCKNRELLRIKLCEYVNNMSAEERSKKYGSCKGKKWYSNKDMNLCKLYFENTQPEGFVLGKLK